MSPDLIWGAAAIFLASVTAGTLGFGVSVVSAPFLLLFLSPKTVVPILLIYGFLVNAVIAVEARKFIDLRRIWPLMVAGLLATPLGTFVLLVASVDALKLMSGIAIVGVSLALLFNFAQPAANEKLAFLAVGLASGILGGSTSLNGPPVMLFYTNQGMPKESFRANLVVYFLFLDAFSLPFLWEEGIITRQVIDHTLWFLPMLVIGTAGGILLSKRIRERVFKRIALSIIILTGGIVTLEGLGLM